MSYRVGIDIGGTFTDLIVFNLDTSEIVAKIKVSTTPRNPEKGVINSFNQLLEKFSPKDVSAVFHATTIATNALLGQLGLELPKTALITTKGFKDVLEIGRQRRSDLYNFFVKRPRILVPRRYRFEVEERVNYRGEVLTPLNEKEVVEITERIRSEGISSVAVCLLHSYVYPEHEKKIGKILRENLSDIYISLSCEVDPEHREYERTSTTVVNAVLMPIVSRYVENLENEIKRLGVDASLFIMQSNGGVAYSDIVKKLPMSIIESGPAAGVIASAYYGKLLNIDRLISFDMGGTTAKAGTVIDGSPLITSEYEVGGEVHAGRIVKGSGYPVRFPFVDLAEVSAGGGSIAWVDEGGALRVGPISAGAEPGPACYGKGGLDPTITDANLLLGRLNQEYLLGGKLKIYRELSEKAFREKICDLTGLDIVDAAMGVVRIANTAMAKILRIVSVERGYDPEEFTMIAFGGAGPMHCCALAEELGINRIVVPLSPGLFSTLGLLVTDLKLSYVKSVRKRISEINPSMLENSFLELERRGVELIRRGGVDAGDIVFERLLDLRYWGQAYELMVPIGKIIDKSEVERCVKRFHEKHEAVYGYSMRDEPVEIVNVRLNCIGIIGKPKLKKYEINESSVSKALIDWRNVFFEKYDDFVKTPVYVRKKLKAGGTIQGPAIIEEYDSTTVIYPEWKAKIDTYGNIIMEK